jgi:hypothetical protein
MFFEVIQLDLGQDIGFAKDEEIFAIELQFGAGVFSVEDRVTGLYGYRFVLTARTCGYDRAALRLLFCGIRDDDAAGCFFFCGGGSYDDPVMERSDAW